MLQKIEQWDDNMFRRQMRVCREDFEDILRLITPLIERDAEMATRSSGSPISARLRLHITLRILAGILKKFVEFV